ncbi:MAG: carbon storage regulator [Gemmataceae bacterium]|nr:carbon storage regulator [Gemmataceae bacterium]
MLVLSRKAGQSLMIEGGITVTLMEVEGGRVRLGIEAPASVRILRSELVASLANESKESQAVGAPVAKA